MAALYRMMTNQRLLQRRWTRVRDLLHRSTSTGSRIVLPLVFSHLSRSPAMSKSLLHRWFFTVACLLLTRFSNSLTVVGMVFWERTDAASQLFSRLSTSVNS